jgi:hypothetical protein
MVKKIMDIIDKNIDFNYYESQKDISYYLNVINYINNNNKFLLIWKINNKKIYENIECSVNYEKINENDRYCYCNICKKYYSFQSLSHWFKIKIGNNKCLYCQQKWKNYTIYINNNKSNFVNIIFFDFNNINIFDTDFRKWKKFLYLFIIISLKLLYSDDIFIDNIVNVSWVLMFGYIFLECCKLF